MSKAIRDASAGRRPPRLHRRRTRRGIAFVYILVAMTVLIGVTSLAVDVGRVQVAKTQLQTAADAAARAGALVMKDVVDGQSSAAPVAAAAAAQDGCDGSPVVLDQNNDVQVGYWDAAAKTFVACDLTVANAVRVTARRVAARGTAIPLMFMQIVGARSTDVLAQSTAVLTPGVVVTPTIPATANPFLAGQPPNVCASVNNPHNNPDWSHGTPGKTDCSPVQGAVPLRPGHAMTFDGVNGSANHAPGFPLISADGYSVTSNYSGSEHGLSNITAPKTSIVAVFLNDAVPGSAAVPPSLDFSTAASRDFTTLSPAVNQIFYIGDGRTSTGDVQQFIVPKGATRLFLADMDGYEWSNDTGFFTCTIHSPPTVTTVH